jgi:glycosyltransferase involved in cell wall biosynthesis
MKISVAMATYNGASYLKEQLDSILRQTRTIDEVIICDDCSKDNTVTIIKEYIQQYQLQNRWSIEVNEKNLGYASNFIKVAKKTTGDIIYFCDQDDIWVEDRVQVMELLMEERQEILMLGSEYEPFESTMDAPKASSRDLSKFKNDNSLEHVKFQANTMFIGNLGCCMCIRRSFLNQILPYWFEGWAHDEFVWKLALCLDGAYVYHGITLKRRLHSANASMGKMRDIIKRVKFLEELLKSHEATLKFARDHRMNEKAIRLIEKNITSVKLRIGLLKDKKYLNTFRLCFKYYKYYHSQKSIPVELYMAIKG